MSPQCLNCGSAVDASYCEMCGQKTSTHRFSLKHIFSHDFVHGIFHVDKGLFYTLKELFVRPGHSIREYIEGKRIRHFNYFTLILLIVTVSVLLEELTPVDSSQIFESIRNNKEMVSFMDRLKEYPKLVTLATIPIYAFVSWALFRKAKLTLAEHVVLNSYRAAGELLLGLLSTASMVVIYDLAVLRVISSAVAVIVPVYSTIFYMQFFKPFEFSRWGLFFRSISAAISYAVLVVIATVVYLLATDPKL